MTILFRKTLREIWQNKFRSLSIITVVALTVALLAGLRASHPVLFNTYDYNMEYYNVADGSFSFSEPIETGNITAIETNSSFLEQNKITNIEGRIHYLTEVVYAGERFQAVVYGVDYPTELNKLVIESKSTDIVNENTILQSNTSCLIETHFATGLFGNDVQLDDKIEVRFPSLDVNFTVKGIAQDSYYSYIVDENTGMPTLGNLAVIWINKDIAQQLRYDGKSVFNQLLFSVEDKLNEEQILPAADALTYFFTTQNIPANSIKFTIYDESDEYTMFIGDAGAVDKMGTIFGLLGLIVSIVIIFNTLNKMIYAQRKNIGLFLAMGSPKSKILFHYTGITMILTVLGVCIGVPLAYAMALGMSQVVVGFMYGFHQIDLTLPVEEFIYAGVISLGVSLICSVLSAWTITTVTPREAMTATFTRIKKTGKTVAEKLIGWLPMFKPIHMIIPLREVFLKKKKSLITILALITSMIFLVNSVAMFYNIFNVMETNFDVYNTYDVQVILETPTHIGVINSFLEDNSIDVFEDINQHEIFVDVYTKIIHNDELLSWTELVCYQRNSTLRTYNVVEGDAKEKSDLSNDSVLLGMAIASKYDLKVDDEIKIGILANHTVKIAGLVGEFIDYSVLWTFDDLQDSGISFHFGLFPNQANGILLKVNGAENLNNIREEIEGKFAVAAWIETEQAREASLAMMEAFLGIMLILLGIGILIGVLFSFQSMYISFMDRQQDFLSFKATGTKKKYIRRIIFWENAILSFVSLILTIPLGYLTYNWTMDYMLEGNFYMPKTIPWFTWPLVLVLSFLALWLATGRILRKIKKMNLADELRQTGAT